jgi:hypothetical protein
MIKCQTDKALVLSDYTLHQKEFRKWTTLKKRKEKTTICQELSQVKAMLNDN